MTPEKLHEVANKANVLIEALPWLKRFNGATVVIKYGGAAMKEESLQDSFARDITLLNLVGLRPVVVHGGGPELTRILGRLGIETRFIEGHRVTDAATADVAQMVLSGRINKDLVARLVRAGSRAVGLSGADAGLLTVRRHVPDGNDIGFVGLPESVDPAILRTLLDNSYVPVISSTADGPGHQVHNVNADLVAAAVAVALKAQKLVYLTDVSGVLVDGNVRGRLTPPEVAHLIADGIVTGGMIPKLETAVQSLQAGVGQVHLIDGRVEHSLLIEVFTDMGLGTLVHHAS